MYKVGQKVVIIEMSGEPQYSGKSGEIKFIDALGQLHGTWGGCALIPSEDRFYIVDDETYELMK